MPPPSWPFPPWPFASEEGRAYGLMVLLASAWLWSLWVALDNPSTPRWVRWGVVSALGIYTHYLFAVVITGWLVVAVVETRGRPRREMWIGIGTLGVLAAPVLVFLRDDMAVQITGGAIGIRLADMMYAGYRLVAGSSLGPPSRELLTAGIAGAIKGAWVWIAVLAPPVGLLLVQGYRALDRIARRRILALSASGLLVGGLVIVVRGEGFGIRYFSWLVVPLAVWLAAGLAHLRTRWRWASAAVLLVVAVISIVARNLDPRRQVEDARGVASYLESSDAPDHPVLLTPPDMARPIAYYIDRPLALALPDQWDPRSGVSVTTPTASGLTSIANLKNGGFGLTDALGLVDAHTRPGEPYYLVYARPFYGDPNGELLAALSAGTG